MLSLLADICIRWNYRSGTEANLYAWKSKYGHLSGRRKTSCPVPANEVNILKKKEKNFTNSVTFVCNIP
jgi:hypothetical protein